MEKGTTYFSKFKHLGPVQIRICKKLATVISVLGVNTFSFDLLPENRDNRNAIMQLALKAYFNEHIDNFDDLEPVKPIKTSIFDLFSKISNPLALDAGSYKDKIKGLIMKNIKEFKWNDIGEFYEVENCENIVDVCIPPIIIRLCGFPENLERTVENKTLKPINESNITKNDDIISVLINKSCEDFSQKHHEVTPYKKLLSRDEIGYLLNFIDGEFKLFPKIKEEIKKLEGTGKINKSIYDSIIMCHERIANRLCGLCIEINENQLSGSVSFESNIKNADECTDHTNLTQESLYKVYSEPVWINSINEVKNMKFKGHTININTSVISRIYIEEFDQFLIYINFEKEFVDYFDESADLGIKTAHATLISGSAKILKAFRRMAEMDSCDETNQVISKFNNLNMRISNTSEKTYLAKEAKKLYKILNLSDQAELRALLECKMDNTEIKLYLSNVNLLVIGPKFKVLANFSIAEIDIFLYNKVIFIVSNQMFSINGKAKKIENTDLTISMLSAINREVSREFCDTFYMTKCKCSKFEGLFCSFHDEIDAFNDSCDQNNSFELVVKLLDKSKIRFDKTVVALDSLCKENVINDLKVYLNSKKSAIFNLEQYNHIFASILKETSNSRLLPFSLNTYAEEETSFTRKKLIIKELIEAFILCQHVKLKSSFNLRESPSSEIFDALIEDDILESYDRNKQGYFLKKYFSLLVSNLPVKSIVNSESLEELVILFSMFLQRNIYYFFDPLDLNRLSRTNLLESVQSNLKSFKQSSVKFILSIRRVLSFLQRNSEHDFIEIVFKSILK